MDDAALSSKFTDEQLEKMKSRVFWSKINRTYVSFGSLLTGSRNAFEGEHQFGEGAPPQNLGGRPHGGGGGRGGRIDINVDDLPLEYVFSNMLLLIP